MPRIKTLVLVGALVACRATGGLPPDQLPRFTEKGDLVKPAGWETWVMVGSSTGLSYTATLPPPAGAAPGMFHNVYVQPWAYRAFMKDRAFPESTMFVLSFYEASRKSTPARAGFYEGDRMGGLEVHVKVSGRDKSGWAFYALGDSAATGPLIPGDPEREAEQARLRGGIPLLAPVAADLEALAAETGAPLG